MKQPCVYIMASRRNGTHYTGVTSNLPKRAFEHREGLVAGFSKKHACKILVWYELHRSMTEAITREKQIKAGSRAKKLALIEGLNPGWKDRSNLSSSFRGAYSTKPPDRLLGEISGLLRFARNDVDGAYCFRPMRHSPRYAFLTSGLTLISAALPCNSTCPVCRM